MSIEYLRSFRLAGYAVFDLVTAFVGVYLLSPWLSRLFLKFGFVVPTISWMLFTLPLGILVHILVGTETLMVKNFLDTNNHFGLKMFIFTLTIAGLLKIKLR